MGIQINNKQGWAGPHHAGSGAGSSGTDHAVRDVAAPVLLTLLIGQQRQSGLLQLVGSVGSCGTQNNLIYIYKYY